jgi:hypothetical protein
MCDDSVICIVDDDEAVVGLEQTIFTVPEDVGVVELCAIVYEPNCTCPIAFPFNVSLSTWDDTAVNPMDYLELNSTLSFDACQTRRCVNVTIVDDLVDEPLEYFNFTLERTPDLDTRISLKTRSILTPENLFYILRSEYIAIFWCFIQKSSTIV